MAVKTANSAIHPSGVGKSSTNLWLGLRWDVFTCVGRQVTLCDPIWQVTPRSSEMEFHSELYSLNFILTYVCVSD